MFDNLRLMLDHPLNRGRAISALSRAAVWQIKSRLMPGPHILPFIGQTKLALRRGMAGATGNVYNGLHEFQDMAFALHLLRPDDLFLDVGANVGVYSLIAEASGAKVVAFEPGERFPDLERNAALNGGRWRCIRAAVGARTGSLRFTQGMDCANRPAIDNEPGINVPMVALDDLGLNRPKLVKIDVEGYEAEVLAGGARTISNADALIIEISGEDDNVFGHGRGEVMELVESWGFRRTDYEPFSRSLVAPTLRGNNIFVRGQLAEVLRSAPRHRIQGREI